METLVDYVPRYMRLGANGYQDQILFVEPTHTMFEEVPVVDDKGLVVERHQRKTVVSAVAELDKYRSEDFKLEALLENGVKLSMVNVNRSQLHTIDELDRIAQSLDGLEEYSKHVEQIRAQEQSWLNPVVEPEKTE